MADDALKSKLGLDTTDFKTQLSTINREIRVVESGFRASAASLGDWANTADGLEMRIKALSTQVDLQRKKVEAVRGEYERVAAEKGKTSRAAQDLVIKLNKETETLGKMESELRQSQGALDKMGDESSDAAVRVDKLDKKQDQAAASASRMNGAMRILASGVKVGAGAIAGLAAATVGAVAGLAKLILSASDTAGELVDMSLQTGLGVEKLQELQYIGGQVGTDVDTIASSLAKMTRAMSDVGTNKDVTQAFQTLGVNVRDANGELRDSEVVFGEVIDALGKIDNETERDALAMEIFGRSAMELNPLIKAGADEIARLTDEAHAMGAVMEEEDVNALESFGDTLAGLKAGLKGTLGTVAAAFLPGLEELVSGARGYMKDLAGIVTGSGGDLGKMASGLGGMLGQLITSIAGRAPEIMQAGLGLIRGLLNAILTALPALIPGVISILQALVNGLIQMAPMLLQAGLTLLITLVDGIITQLPLLLEAGLQLIITLALGIAKALPELIPAIIEIIPTIIQTLIENLPLLLDAALQIILALVQGLITAIPTLIDAVPPLITALIEAILEMLPMISAAAVELVLALIEGIGTMLPQLGRAAGDIITALATGIVSLATKLWEIGRAIVEGIWEGISNNADWLVGQIFGFFGEVIDAIKELLGIESPSKVFAGIGENMALGLGTGFSNQFRQIEREIGQSISGMMAGFSTGGLTVARGGAGAPGGMSLVVNMNVAAMSSDLDPYQVAHTVADVIMRTVRR